MSVTPKLMTTAQFAKEVGVCVRTLIRWHAQGKLVPYLVLPGGDRRYTEAQLDQLKTGGTA